MAESRKTTLVVVVALISLEFTSAKPFGRGFPNFFSMKEGGDRSFGIAYPRSDLSPLMVQFSDPSLKNYPVDYSSASAVRPLARFKRQTFPEFSDLFLKPNLALFDEGVEAAFGRSQRGPEDEPREDFKPPPTYPPEDHFGNSETFQPLPLSNPHFALPVVHEDPHFQPDYFSVQFQKPIKRHASGFGSHEQARGFFPSFFNTGPFGYPASRGFSPLRVIEDIHAAAQRYAPF